MRSNFILQFTEQPDNGTIESDFVEYSEKLNLNVIKGTETPAVLFREETTVTMTKAGTEATDSDHEGLGRMQQLLDTETNTFKSTEGSDSDRDVKGFLAMLDTQTLTEQKEASDSDRE